METSQEIAPRLTRPSIVRALRITWTAFFGIAAVLLAVLWVRSYSGVDILSWMQPSTFLVIFSGEGATEPLCSERGAIKLCWEGTPDISHGHLYFERRPIDPEFSEDVAVSVMGVEYRKTWYGKMFAIRYRTLITLISLFAVAPWLPWWSKHFSYVGACQVWMGCYMFVSRGMSRLVAFAQTLRQSQRRGRGDGPFVLGLTSKAPRGAQSAIRAHGVQLPAHEIPCASDDAHSVSRALDVESLAQSRCELSSLVVHSEVPLFSGHAATRASVRFSFDNGAAHPGEQFVGDRHGGRFAAAALGDPQEDASHCSSVRMAVQAACCRIQCSWGEPVLAMCPMRCFPAEAKTRGLSPAKRPLALRA